MCIESIPDNVYRRRRSTPGFISFTYDEDVLSAA